MTKISRTLRIFNIFVFCILVAGNAFAVTPPELAGSLQGQFEVNNSGAATYGIDIAVPPGTNGMEPKLALVYSSSSGAGPFGPGWSITGLSEISRCPTTQGQDGYSGEIEYSLADRFCLDGQRLIAVNGDYGVDGTQYRTRIETFARVYSHGAHLGHGPEYFSIEFKNGLTYRYGYTSNSRQENINTDVVVWSVDRISDRSGNYMSITYDQDIFSGALLPLRIDYTGNDAAGLAPYASVQFHIVNSTNSETTFIRGAPFVLNRHIDKIETYLDDTLIHAFNLEYEYENLHGNDRLIAISQCGSDGTCLPATTFSWGDNPQSVEQFGENYVLNTPSPQYLDSDTHPIIFGDWNGDGRSDFARLSPTALNMYVSTGSGFNFLSAEGQLAGFSQNTRPFITGDWNGDGLTDVGRVEDDRVMFYTNRHSADGLWLYGHIPDFGYYSYQQGHTLSGYENEDKHPIITGDWNGDGRTDVARYDRKTLNGRIKFYISTGTSFTYLGALGGIESSVPLPSTSSGFSGKHLFTGDWNGDGLTDIGWNDNSTSYFYVSTGESFVPCHNGNPLGSQFCATSELSMPGGYSGTIYTGDWNRDGRTDIAALGTNDMKFLLSLGDGRFGNPSTLSSVSNVTNSNLATRPILIGDFNGDGKSDIAQVQAAAIRFYFAHSLFDSTVGFVEGDTIPKFTDGQFFPNTGTHPFLQGDWDGDGISDLGRGSTQDFTFSNHNGNAVEKILSIVDGFGKSISINYGPLTNSSLYTPDTTSSYPILDLSMPLTVVASYSVSDGIGTEGVVSYRYAGLKYDHLRREINGFRYIEVIDQGTERKTESYYRQDDPFRSAIERKEIKLLDGTLISKEEQNWEYQTLGSGSVLRYLTYVSSRSRERYELDGSLVTSSVVEDTYDYWGNLTSSTKTFFDGSWEETLSSYDNDTSDWTIGQLQSVVVTKQAAIQGSPQLSRTTFFHYLSNGLLDCEEIEPNSLEFKITKTHSYDTFGNILSTTTSGQGFEDRTETTQYDSKGRFKVSTANALNHVNFMEYDEGLGKLSQQTDPNGLITRWEFDQFGRAKRELRPDGTELQTEYVKVTNPSLPTANYIIRVIETAKPVAVSYYDLLGREVRSELEGFDGTKIFVDKEYNEKGNLVRVSEPYFEGESSRWSMSEYDALDRVIRITEPGNRIITQTYEGLTTSTTNSLNQTKSRTINHRGLLESTQDATGNITSYHYDSVGNIIEIIDPLGNHTTFQYDLAGRKISIDDPDSGVTNFIYNALGELVSQTNANNETIFFEYDRLGRMTIRTHQEGSEFWEYDTQLNGVGKIAGTSGLGGYREHYHYDDLGRINSIVKQIEGNQYLVSQHYDSFGRISSYTYPSGFMLNYVYNERGYLANITRGDTGASIWRPTGMNARGQIVQEVFGNGLTTTSQYNEDTGYLESRISGLIQNTSFQFDSIGNLRERRDLIVSMTEQFDYDNLNRLVESHVLEQDPVFVTYDALGNITTKSDVGNYAYNSIDGGPHAVTSITGAKSSVYTYDNVGNRLTSSDGQITYSSTGKPLVIEQGASRVEFSLNGEDQRIVERVLKSGSLLKKKVYAAPLYEEITSHGSTVQIHYIKGLEGLVAVFKKTVEVNTKPYRSLKQNKMKLEMNYIHLDHLGSLSLITNHFGEEVERLSFDSWGNRRDGFDWGITPSSSKYDRGFTGHEHLDEVSLIHMNGRVYDPVIGRFVSPDSLIESVDNLQALNPYSYVLNNPLSFTDPSGHFSFKKFWKKALKLGKTFVKMGINWAAFTIGNSIAGPFGGAFLSSAVNSMLQGASPGQAFGAGLRGIPMGLVRALVNSGIGDLTSGLGVIANAAGHAMGEAGMAAASGGDVRSAMLGGFATTFGGTFNFAFKDIPLGSLLTGGTVTALSGGKFLDGAMNASFQYLYNDMMHPGSSEQSPWNGVLGPGSSMNIYGAAASQFPAQSAVQSKAGTFWGDFGNVMGSFADNHPYYMAYMNGTAILIGGVEGAILLSGFKISSALSKASMLQGYSTSMMNNGLSGVLHHFLHDELHDSAQGLGMAIFKNAQTVRYLDGMYRSYGAVSQGTPPNLHGWGATNWKTGLH